MKRLVSKRDIRQYLFKELCQLLFYQGQIQTNFFGEEIFKIQGFRNFYLFPLWIRLSILYS